MALKLQTGTFESTLDEKGRVVIPASLRDRYTGELVITQGQDFCVWIMTGKTYEKFLENLENTASSLSYEEYMAFQYLHVAPAQVVEIDQKYGRIPVPAAIRSYAKLSKDCLVLSIKGRLELWNAEIFRAHENQMHNVSKEASRKFSPGYFFPKEDA